MIAASGLSGDTLVACRFPVVQLPTWQVPVQALCSAAKRPGRLCPAGLTRAVSLPERDSLSREHAFAGGRRPVWSSYSSLNEERAEEEGASDSSGRYDSTSSPEEAASHPRREAGESSEARGALRLHNSFLPNVELDEDEEDEDSDGDNLHRYYEDSSFVLHGNSNWPLSRGDVDGGWGPGGIAWGGDRERRWLGEQPDPPDPPQRCRGEEASYALKDMRGCSPELLNGHADYVSDSSCNSSDGVLVNFCAMYNRSNNPATPLDLSGPALHPGSPEGSVFLNLRPVPRSPAADRAPRWSPRGLDSNCNLCSLEPSSPGLSSLEASDLNACLRGPASLAMGTNQKYYKLVTCDLSSQSPSPAWSSLSSGAEGPSRSNEHRKSSGRHKESNQDRADQQEDQTLSNCSSCQLIDHQVPGCRKEPLDHMQELQCSPQNPGASASASTATVNLREGEETRNGAVVRHLPEGACSSEDKSMRCNKAQRPTSLPIQPFVLVPAGEPRAQRLGGLLEQYMSQKSGSESGLKFRDKSSLRASDPQPSPGGARCPVLLEAPSSSDTCSTCTPSPSEYFVGTWSQSGRGQGHASQWTSRTSPFSGKRGRFLHVPSDLSKTPTYQDLLVEQSHSITTQPQTYTYDSVFSHTPPTLPLTAEAHYPNLQVRFPPTSSQPEARFTERQAAADSGFSHSPFTAALSSAPPPSSLSSLLSSAAPGPHPPRTQDSAEPRGGRSQRGQRLMPSDGPPADFCLSPDASYESMSISHLQRRGLLRSVSRAVDLVMAHFGSSRDPEEKMRLGNSSWSPTIVGLVLEHLCPAIQNILEDGLRDHKLDLIIGQRRNHSWSVVEVSTRIGPSTRVLHSLVSKVRQCPQLTTNCMRLRAFVMGLLNLRALEFWLSHLQGQEDVVSAYYHSWGFLSMSLGRCRPMFQELLLLLQPLSVLPFDLNLLLEPRLLRGRRLRPEELCVSPPPPPPPCSALLATSWPLLQADSQRGQRRTGLQQMGLQGWETLSPLNSNCIKRRCGGARAHRSPCLSTVPEWWPAQDHFVEGVENCNQVYAGDWSQISMESRREERGGFEASPVQAASPHQGALRWAKLFGATDGSTRAEAASQNHAGAQTRRRPSQWLHLDRSQLGQLAQSIRTMKLAAQMDKRKHY